MVRVWACPNSQHSKWKVIDYINPKFPKLSDYISVLYGNYFDAPLDTNLTKFDNLSLMALYNMTQPEMVVLRVKLANMKLESFESKPLFSVTST